MVSCRRYRCTNSTQRSYGNQLSCKLSTVTLAPGGSTNVNCTVSSFNSFDDPVALTCSQGVTTCTVSPSEVTPPRDGTVDAQFTISVGASVAPGTYTVKPKAQSHLAERFASIEVVVKNAGKLIFVDGFE